MPSIFSKIVKGEIPCHKVWEDARHLAFLDINPWVEGHTLVIPKQEHDYLFDMPEANYTALHQAAAQVARLLKDKLGCKRVCSCVIGYEVPHAHIHLLPTNAMADFVKPGTFGMATKPDFAALAKKLSADSGTLGKLVEAFNTRDPKQVKALLAANATAKVLDSPFPEENGPDDIEKKSLNHLLGDPDTPLTAKPAKLDGRQLVLFFDTAERLDCVAYVTEAQGKITRLEYAMSFHRAEELNTIALKLGLKRPE